MLGRLSKPPGGEPDLPSLGCPIILLLRLHKRQEAVSYTHRHGSIIYHDVV